MGISNPQNFTRPRTPEVLPYGVRIGLRALDPFAKICGPNWQHTHWYATAHERDAALTEMSRKHEYSRPGDRPATIFTKVENLAALRGL